MTCIWSEDTSPPRPPRLPLFTCTMSCQLPGSLHAQPRQLGPGAGSGEEQSRAGQALSLTQKFLLSSGDCRVSLRCDRNSHRQGYSLFSFSLLNNFCFHLESFSRRGEEERGGKECYHPTQTQSYLLSPSRVRVLPPLGLTASCKRSLSPGKTSPCPPPSSGQD